MIIEEYKWKPASDGPYHWLVVDGVIKYTRTPQRTKYRLLLKPSQFQTQKNIIELRDSHGELTKVRTLTYEELFAELL